MSKPIAVTRVTCGEYLLVIEIYKKYTEPFIQMPYSQSTEPRTITELANIALNRTKRRKKTMVHKTTK